MSQRVRQPVASLSLQDLDLYLHPLPLATSLFELSALMLTHITEHSSITPVFYYEKKVIVFTMGMS